MALAESSEAYKQLREIVGDENITVDPVVMDTYLWQWLGDLVGEKGNCFMPLRPEAVVLPASTREVQQVVKVCNRFGLKFKAHSTGWISFAAPLTEGVVLIDLRRMNRILEINTRDMYALIEPYVTFSQLQAELMKLGLNCEVNAAGSNCSALAQATAGFGAGYGNYHMGYGSGTLLGVEWVLPDGEVLRMGSPGSGCGWITSDGPGPSLKGIMRGHMGTLGGCGVFTKCALRVYHWPGPAEIECENESLPGYERFANLPDNIAMYYLYFDDYEKRSEAICKVGEEDIGYVMGFMQRGLAILGLADTNAHFLELKETLFDALPSISFVLLLATNTLEELEHQKRVLEKILEETGGGYIELLQQEPFNDVITLHLIKVGTLSAHAVCGRSGAFLCAPGSNAVTRRIAGRLESLSIELKKKYIEEGKLVDDGGEGTWGVVWDHGHTIYIENLVEWDPADPESSMAHIRLQEEVNRETIEKLSYLSSMGAMVEGSAKMDVEDMVKLRDMRPAELIEKSAELAAAHSPYDESLGPRLRNYHFWLRRVREKLDPNNASDATPP